MSVAEKKQKTSHGAPLMRFYRTPAFTAHAAHTLLAHLTKHLEHAGGITIEDLQTEYCFYVETEETNKGSGAYKTLTPSEQDTLHWLLSETFEPQQTRLDSSFLQQEKSCTWAMASSGSWRSVHASTSRPRGRVTLWRFAGLAASPPSSASSEPRAISCATAASRARRRRSLRCRRRSSRASATE
ncbi:hypothetical protein PINS_up020865 [Pythium insidiosum]|nr:hypothetical protein PINS_up020865 [Pythium insidiosum]